MFKFILLSVLAAVGVGSVVTAIATTLALGGLGTLILTAVLGIGTTFGLVLPVFHYVSNGITAISSSSYNGFNKVS
jgi:hypothetical protein